MMRRIPETQLTPPTLPPLELDGCDTSDLYDLATLWFRCSNECKKVANELMDRARERVYKERNE